MWVSIGEVAGVVAGGIAQRVLADSARCWIGYRLPCRAANDNVPVYGLARKGDAPDAQVWREQTSIRGYSAARRGRAAATEW